MTTPDSNQKLINTLAPALRQLLSTDCKAPQVKLTASLDEGSDLEIDIKADPSDQKAVVSELSAAIDSANTISSLKINGDIRFAISPLNHASGRAVGKVVIVTGAAQGFGLEIAQSLAAEGASVVLADINIDGANAAAEKICTKHGKHAAIGAALNVTDAASVQSMVADVVNEFGGFDAFIANAGVLKAESVKTQPEKDFDFVNDVNYKGYFLCTQSAAPVLAAAHLANPEYMSDIIQINSKSGLEGSNRNGAYAGSKFGGLGLTQSFALELIEDGIKVNSICPGNFFDGPLWSDPDRGLFVQYLNSGKVPGAETINDVKSFYEAKVPMGRGCTTPDVMTAVYYLMEQKYETGQAVPVTGGQVMLK